MNTVLETIFFAGLGGVLPAVIWLWFWLKEDDEHPEPSKAIFFTFIFGIMAVPIALIAQLVTSVVFLQSKDIAEVMIINPSLATIIVIVWALIEEIVKFGAAYYGGLHKKTNDEPLDMIIYLITASLGFAALENAMFLFAPLLEGDTTTALITGNMRFLGATLVHVGSSAILGVFLALSYFYKKQIQNTYIIVGFVIATTLHAVFNLFIIRNQESLFSALLLIWLVIVIIILFFEKIKKIHLNKINNKDVW